MFERTYVRIKRAHATKVNKIVHVQFLGLFFTGFQKSNENLTNYVELLLIRSVEVIVSFMLNIPFGSMQFVLRNYVINL